MPFACPEKSCGWFLERKFSKDNCPPVSVRLKGSIIGSKGGGMRKSGKKAGAKNCGYTEAAAQAGRV
jgi:hypothetical protein